MRELAQVLLIDLSIPRSGCFCARGFLFSTSARYRLWSGSYLQCECLLASIRLTLLFVSSPQAKAEREARALAEGYVNEAAAAAFGVTQPPPPPTPFDSAAPGNKRRCVWLSLCSLLQDLSILLFSLDCPCPPCITSLILPTGNPFALERTQHQSCQRRSWKLSAEESWR
jgi:hypothetical protein